MDNGHVRYGMNYTAQGVLPESIRKLLVSVLVTPKLTSTLTSNDYFTIQLPLNLLLTVYEYVTLVFTRISKYGRDLV